jgi:hypothetical protein
MLDALRRWSEDEFRSTNSQIEMILARALDKAGRVPKPCDTEDPKGSKAKKRPFKD